MRKFQIEANVGNGRHISGDVMAETIEDAVDQLARKLGQSREFIYSMHYWNTDDGRYERTRYTRGIPDYYVWS